MLYLGLAIGVQLSFVTFAIGYNMGADVSKELKLFRERKSHILTGTLNDARRYHPGYYQD